MSIPETKKNVAFSHIVAKIGYVAMLCLIVFAIWFLGNVWIERVVNTQQKQVSSTILKTINEEAKLDLLMPNIVFITGDTGHKKRLEDSIKSQIATILTTRYLTNLKEKPEQITFQPFFVFPDSANNQGNYTLTKAHLEELKNHIMFLTSQVDKAVTATKDEINKEIDRINTWVSIWIGVLSIFGTIIPLFYNYKNNEDLKKIKIDANEAKDKAEKAHTLIDTHKEDIKKVKEISSDLGTLKESFEEFKDEVVKAKDASGNALITSNLANNKATKVEKLVFTLNDISKIKDIDATFLLYQNNPLETLKSYLSEIHTNLNNYTELFDNPIIKDVFRQLSLKLYLLAPSNFISPRNFDLLNQFSLALSTIVSQPITQETYSQALRLLSILNREME